MKKSECYEYWYIAFLCKNTDKKIASNCKEMLLKKSEKITDKIHRKSFLENIKLHKKISIL